MRNPSEDILKAGGLDFNNTTPTGLWQSAYMAYSSDFAAWGNSALNDLASDPWSDKPLPSYSPEVQEGLFNPQPGKEYGNDPSGQAGQVDPNAQRNENIKREDKDKSN